MKPIFETHPQRHILNKLPSSSTTTREPSIQSAEDGADIRQQRCDVTSDISYHCLKFIQRQRRMHKIQPLRQILTVFLDESLNIAHRYGLLTQQVDELVSYTQVREHDYLSYQS